MPDSSPFAFSQIANMGTADTGYQTAPNITPEGEIPPELKAALDNLRQTQAHLSVAHEEAQRPPQPTEVTMKTSPEGDKQFSIKGGQDLMEYYGKAGQFYQQAMGGMQQELDRMKRQEEAVRKQPAWVQLATALSANLAQARDLPGWVQAAGRTAAQLNPQADQIRNQRLLLMEKGAGIAGQGLALQNAQLYHQQMLGQKADTLEQAKAKEVDEIGKRIVQTARLVFGKTGQPPDEATMRGIVAAEDPRGVYPQDRIPGLITAATGMATAQEGAFEKAQTRKMTMAEFTSGLAKDRAADLTNLNHENRLAEIKQRFRDSISPDRLAFEKELIGTKNQLRVELDRAKSLGTVDRAGLSQLGEAAANDLYVGKVTRMLSNPALADVQGPLLSWNPKTGEWNVNENVLLPGAMQPAEFSAYKSQIKHELPRMLKLIMGGGGQGGISIMRTVEGKKMLEELGASKNQRPDQILAIMKVIADTNNDNKQKVVLQHKNVDWLGDYGELLGLNDPINQDYFAQHIDSFGGQMRSLPSSLAGAPTVSGPAPGARDAGGLRQHTTPNDPAFLDAVKKLPAGKAIKVDGKLYTRDASGNPAEVR